MLPTETMDCILSFLQRDQAALKACSAAHPLLSSLAERHLITHMIFYIGIQSKHHPCCPTDGFPVPLLSRRLSEKPHLAHRIRSITLDGSGFSFPKPPKVFKELSSVLPSISHPEKVTFRNTGWSEFPEDFRSTLLDFFRKPRMKEICLQDAYNFPLMVLDDFRNIKNLRLGSTLGSYLFRAVRPTLSSIESLSLVDINSDIIHIAWGGSKLKGLNSLLVKIKIQPFPNLSPVFNSCSETLKNLSLDIGSFYRTTYREGIDLSRGVGLPFDLSTLPCLELVTVYATIGVGKYPTHEHQTLRFVKGCNSSLPAIKKLVASAGLSLNHLILNLNFQVGGAHYLHDGMEWEPLVRLCDTLRHLQVDLCVRTYAQLPFSTVVESLLINEDLSRLVEQGSLIIKSLPVDS